jgi:hypothetical protein
MYFIQCAYSRAISMSIFRNNVLGTAQVFGFPFLAILACILSPDASDSGPSCDILNLADVANVLLANSIPRSFASDTP